jgi:hypothetical protein
MYSKRAHMTFAIVVLLIFWTVKTGYVRHKVVASLSSSIVKFSWISPHVTMLLWLENVEA